jgi:predicted DNA-binding transcriptional regulator AlpA
MEEQPKTRLLRFAELRARGIVSSWPQLRRLIDNHDFPAGFLLSAQVRVWDEATIDAWLAVRRAAAAKAEVARRAAREEAA